MNILPLCLTRRILSMFPRKEARDTADELTFYVLSEAAPAGGSELFPSVEPGSLYLCDKGKRWASCHLLVCFQNNMAICALMMIESDDDPISYIQWVETSGHWCCPRTAQSGITKSIVRGAVDYQLANNRSVSLFSNGQDMRQSAFFFNKRPMCKLSPHDLQSWWRNIFVDDPEIYSAARLYFWNPSSDLACPFTHLADTCTIPLFPDDPMTRHLGQSSTLSLESFLTTLPYRSEYIGGVGTHFFLSPIDISITNTKEPKTRVSNQSEALLKAMAKSKKTLLDVWINSIFPQLDFSTRIAAQTSSLTLIKEIESLTELSISISKFSIPKLDCTIRLIPPYTQVSTNTPLVSEGGTLNNIQSLVKRKC